MKKPKEDLNPETMDRIRRLVGSQNVNFINGEMALTATGLINLSQAIIDGKIEGNRESAKAMIVKVGEFMKNFKKDTQ
jgi:hypothetical protein